MELNQEILNINHKYIVGVSGGCDSMALLSLLIANNYQVVVCHVNYHLRHDSNQDQELVENYCHENKIKYYVKEVKDGEYQASNFQAQARDIRYQFYLDKALEENCQGVILAHHLDDVVETIIMQLIRKNTKSYLGIKPESKVRGLKVLRPLLKQTKAKIIFYCLKQGIPYRDDYTNFMTDFTRDYVRNVLIPEYTAENKAQLLKDATRHNQIISLRDKMLENDYREYDLYKKINYRRYSRYELESIIYYMLSKIIYKPLISEGLINEIIKQVDSNKPNITIDLPINAVFIKEYDNIYVEKKVRQLSYSYTYDYLVYEKRDFFEIGDQGHLNQGVGITEKDFPITIRSYKPGDKIKTMYGTKKVTRLFIDFKIPSRYRKTWPILVNKDGDILLIPNLAKNVKYKDTKPNIFVIEYDDNIKE